MTIPQYQISENAYAATRLNSYLNDANPVSIDHVKQQYDIINEDYKGLVKYYNETKDDFFERFAVLKEKYNPAFKRCDCPGTRHIYDKDIYKRNSIDINGFCTVCKLRAPLRFVK